ncbi:MAG: hypothetical protein R2713_13275 [Ilumatobacteraceae bacterium]
MALTIAAQQPMHDTHAVVEDGAVDADGHILEPPTLWEEYIDPAFRDRALRFRIDEHGLEELEIDGRRSRMSRAGFPATLGAMGAPDLGDIQKNPERTYLREAPYGSMDPAERIRVLDAEHIEEAILYTTVGLLWRPRCRTRRSRRRTPRPTTAGSASSAPMSPGCTPRLTCRSPIRWPLRRSSSARSARERSVGTSHRSPTTRSRSGIPTTIRCSPPHKTWACRSRSTRPSSRSGPRAPVWATGST